MKTTNDWQEQLHDWLATQHGTAGWELKLEALIKNIRDYAYKEGANDTVALTQDSIKDERLRVKNDLRKIADATENEGLRLGIEDYFKKL